MTAKNLEEVRGLFGAAEVDREGVREGRKSSKIFWYTGRLVIGLKQYKEKGAAELQRVLALKGGRGRNGGWGKSMKDIRRSTEMGGKRNSRRK
jgi:hypothetical protein